MKAMTRSERSAVISGIVTSIRDSSTGGGGFVRLDAASKRWYEVGDKVARDKVGHFLRDSMRALETPITKGNSGQRRTNETANERKRDYDAEAVQHCYKKTRSAISCAAPGYLKQSPPMTPKETIHSSFLPRNKKSTVVSCLCTEQQSIPSLFEDSVLEGLFQNSHCYPSAISYPGCMSTLNENMSGILVVNQNNATPSLMPYVEFGNEDDLLLSKIC
jgi:hypothetical protein